MTPPEDIDCAAEYWPCEPTRGAPSVVEPERLTGLGPKGPIPAFLFGEAVARLLSRVPIGPRGPLCLRVSGAVAPSAPTSLSVSPARVVSKRAKLPPT